MIDDPLHIMTVTGSPRPGSISTNLARAVSGEARRRGAEIREWDLGERSLPPYLADENDPGSMIHDARKLVLWADAFVLATPDYHGGPSGRLKNFLDHFWRELTGKLFAIVVASNDKGLTVQDQLRTTIRQCYGWALPYGVSASSRAIDENGCICDADVQARLRMMARDTVVFGTLLRRQRRVDLAGGGAAADTGFISSVLAE